MHTAFRELQIPFCASLRNVIKFVIVYVGGTMKKVESAPETSCALGMPQTVDSVQLNPVILRNVVCIMHASDRGQCPIKSVSK